MIAHSTMAPLSSLNTISESAPPSLLPAPGTDGASGASAAFAGYSAAASNGAAGIGNAPMTPPAQSLPARARRGAGAGGNCAVFSATAKKAALRAMPGYIDGSTALRDTVAQWEGQGVSRKTIDAIRNGVPRPPRDRDAPALFALGTALQASGTYAKLRAQAINVYRGTCAWQADVARLQTEHPGESRQQLERRLADTLFRLDGNDHRQHAAVLDSLLRPESIIDLDSADSSMDGGIDPRDSGKAGFDAGISAPA